MLQARRLGEHLAARSASTGPLLHVFASDLQRATLTAQAIVDAHSAESESESETPRASVTVVQVPDLRERDFRSSEGVKFGVGVQLSDAETHLEMHARVVRFIEVHLDPILMDVEPTLGTVTGSLVIVAHGLILNVLLSALLSRFAPTELERLISTGRGSTEYLASWTNTGFVEALIHSDAPTPLVDMAVVDVEEPADDVPVTSTTPSPQASIRLEVVVVNSVEHLRGLKKTRGGIGSAKFDSKQKTMDSFFKPAAKQ